tara:strand:+ start:9010 stop:9219 length:210 start_codon:yes stop_codon:yes gene_type:complete
MDICPRCCVNKFTEEDLLVNRYAVRHLKVACCECREKAIRKYHEEDSIPLVCPEFSHEEYLAIPYAYRR